MPVFEMQEPAAREEFEGGPMADDDIHVAELTRTSFKNRKNRDGEEYRRVLWRFSIIDSDGDQDGRIVYGETGDKLVDHPDCKLKCWSEAILGKQLTKAEVERFNTDDLNDMKCRIVIGRDDYEKDGEQRTSYKVKDVLPATSRYENPF